MTVIILREDCRAWELDCLRRRRPTGVAASRHIVRCTLLLHQRLPMAVGVRNVSSVVLLEQEKEKRREVSRMSPTHPRTAVPERRKNRQVTATRVRRQKRDKSARGNGIGVGRRPTQSCQVVRSPQIFAFPHQIATQFSCHHYPG